MSKIAETVTKIDKTTGAIAVQLTDALEEIATLRQDVDNLKLAGARLAGQIDMLWKLAGFLGLPGILALAKALLT